MLATAEDAGRAMDMFNGYEWMGRVLEVRLERMERAVSSAGVGLGGGGGGGSLGVGGGGMGLTPTISPSPALFGPHPVSAAAVNPHTLQAIQQQVC